MGVDMNMDQIQQREPTHAELIERYEAAMSAWTELESRLSDLRAEMKAGRDRSTQLKREMRELLRRLGVTKGTRIHFCFHPSPDPSEGAIEVDSERIE